MARFGSMIPFSWTMSNSANRTINFSQLIWSDVQDDDDKQLSNQEKTQVAAPSKKKNRSKGCKTRFTCKFLPRWLNEEEDENGDKLSQYIIPDKDDKHRAICTVCFTSVSVANQGKGALLQHARGGIHKERMKLKKGSSAE